ncbi:AraC family transcriptional regulator [Phenylobacterium sp.]|jgi:AraC family transcriptional regulator|uniref:AraC family transcriptional regulator n=1 Tax=Phenylobacterium sp. TaxID=1871053 RepID=UPI002E3517E4|nr:AraC family transcriptional regulator [Phenylobacterium sp.]HEX2559137.1 AraC family transcriptional regulator [Phenylobacterium sp.]
MAAESLLPLLIALEEDLESDTRLRTLAERAGASPFHFHRRFAAELGETPKRRLERLRLERAAYQLAVSTIPVVEVALGVGFNAHETFSRAFRRRFGVSPSRYRKAAQAAQADRMRRMAGFRGDGCRLSEVRFLRLAPMTLIAARRFGAYAAFDTRPFLPGDTAWAPLADWGEARGLAVQRLAIGFFPDDPGVTPGEAQRADVCLAVEGDPPDDAHVRRIDFPGGLYGAITHAGPYETIDQAYRTVADGIRRSDQYVFDVGPPMQVFHEVHVGGDPAANLTEVLFPVVRRR